MTDQEYEPQKEWTDWWPTGRDWWISNSESVQNLVRRAFFAGWQQRNGQLLRLAYTPDSARPDPERLKAAPPAFRPGFLPSPSSEDEITRLRQQVEEARAADKDRLMGAAGTYITFEGKQDPAMRLQEEFADAERVHKEQQRFIPTELMPAIPAETGPQSALKADPGKMEHTETVWEPKWPPGPPEEDIFEQFGAPGPVSSPFFDDPDLS